MSPSCPPITLLLFSCLCLLTAGLEADEARGKTETNTVGMKLRLIEGGRFLMGSDARERGLSRDFPLSINAQFFGNPEHPRHATWITRPFWIGVHEVTVGQWKTFIDETGYVTTAEKSGDGIVAWTPTPEDTPLYQSHDFEKHSKYHWRNPGFEQAEDHPVVGVSWTDAKAFLAWLSEKEGATYRLPTEAEWEFACRAGSDTWFSFGDQPRGTVHRHANLANVELEQHRPRAAERQWLQDWEKAEGDGFVFTAPVGRYEANPLGLHDLHGNAWEWCEDLWLDTFYQRFDAPERNLPREIAIDPVNLSEPQTEANRFRTIRGGSWCNGPIICRSSSRTAWDEPDAACYIGFRVVKEADASVPSHATRDLDRLQSARQAILEAGGEFQSGDGIAVTVHFGSDAPFPSAVLDHLAVLPDLVGLSFGQREETAIGNAELETIAGLVDLEMLDFRGSFTWEEADLSLLAELPLLERLSFSRSSSITDRELGALSKLESLVQFRAYGARGGLTDAGIRHLAGNGSLTELDLMEISADGRALASLTGLPLEVLSLTGAYDAESGLNDANAVHLSRFSRLTELNLNQQDRITDATLLEIGKLTGLEQLNLHGCSGISPAGFAPIGNLERLRTLNLQGTSAADEALEAISGIPRLQNLRLGSEAITNCGLASLSRLFSLQDLYLETCRATDEGVKHLGRINRLQRLDIGVPAMTGTGLAPLARLPELQDLRLRSPALTDIVFEQFARAKSLRKLRLVERGWQPPAALTDAGLEAIASATWLTELWLPRNDTGLTEEAIVALNERMAKTNVIPYTVDWDRPEPTPAN